MSENIQVEIVIDEMQETPKKKCSSCKKKVEKNEFYKDKDTNTKEYKSCNKCRIETLKYYIPKCKKNMETMICECGLIFRKTQMYKHTKSSNHALRMLIKENIKDENDPLLKKINNSKKSPI